MLFLGVGVGEPCERRLPSLLELGGGGREHGPLPRSEGLQKGNMPSTPAYNRLRNLVSWSIVLGTWARFLKEPR